METPIREFSKKYKLSQREQDVLKLMIRKVVNAEEISQHLGISQNTVRIHVKNINAKVGAKSKSEILGSFIGFLDSFYKLSASVDEERQSQALSEVALSSDLP
ncbi:MAG: helix-turn-helix transcriptional regulator [Oligoflexus sp.]